MEKFLKGKLKNGKFQNVSAVRSKIMSCIPGRRNRSTEVALRFELVRAGVRGWKMHYALIGKPDFFFPRQCLAIFVDGCFWHGCSRCGHIPKTRSAFWSAKILRNKQRDARNSRALRSQGVRVVRLWEHDLANLSSRRRVMIRIVAMLQASKKELRPAV
jgi:DNA mismatch endonuclease (patch repair protein)